MKTRFSLAAEHDLSEAAAYYEQQFPGLSGRFLDEVEAALKRIAAFPEAWQKLSENSRRCRLQRFPYGLIYSLYDDHILIVAIGHLHREPGHWREQGEK
jgi:plasmid stabilization system protein ParE